MGEPPPESKYVISKDYRVKYSRRVYVSTPFELTVAFAEPGTLRKSEPKLTVRDGRVLFQSPDPEPMIKVALLFAPGTFESNQTAQEKRLKKRGSTAFSFWLKPLRSEDCLLTVSISYAAPEQVPEQLEQIQISTVQEDYGQQRTTTTLVKTPRTLHWTYRPLDQVTLNVSAAGFLRLNARELDLLSKGLGALIALFLVTLSFVTGRALDWTQAVELVVLGVATPLGLTFYDGLKGTLKPPKPEESS
jgi:hypothetical protein